MVLRNKSEIDVAFEGTLIPKGESVKLNDDLGSRLKAIYWMQLEEADSATGTFEVPQEVLDPLKCECGKEFISSKALAAHKSLQCGKDKEKVVST